MNDQPIYVTFEFAGNLSEEVNKMTLGIKGMRDESANTFKRLLADSNEAFLSMSENGKRLAVSIQEDINSLRQLSAIQDSLNASFEQGTISTEAYVEAKARLAVQEADLKEGISRNMQALDEEVAARGRSIGSIAEKKEALQELINRYQSLSEAQRNSGEGEQLLSEIKSLKNEISGLDSVFETATESSTSFLDSVSSIPGPLGSVATGIKAATKAALAFIATPLGIVLAAIAATLAAVTSWFRRTEEGENALAVASAMFGQVLNSLLDVVDKVGEWLYKAFTNPKEALADLTDFIKGQFTNRLSAISLMGKALVKIFSGDLKEGFQEFGDAFLQFQTGVTDVRAKTMAFLEDVREKTIESGKLAERLNQLEAKRRQLVVDRAEMEAKINRLRDDAYDMSIPEKQRAESLKQALALTDQIYDRELAIAREEYEIIKKKNSLSNSNKADLMAEAEAEAKISDLQAQRYSLKRTMRSQANTLDGQMARNASEAAIDLLEKELKNKKEQYELYYQQVERLGKETAQRAYISLMEEGESYLDYLKNRIATLEKNPDRTPDENDTLSFLYAEQDKITGKKTAIDLLKEQIEKIKLLYEGDIPKLKEKLLELKDALLGDTSEIGIQKINVVDQALSQADVDAEKYFKNLLSTYQSNFRKLATLEENYQRDIAFLRSRITDKTSEEEKKRIEDAIKARAEAYGKAALQDSDVFQKIFADLERESTSSLIKLLEKAKKIDLSGLAPQDAKIFLDSIIKLEDEIRKRNPFKQMGNDFNNLIKAIKSGTGIENAMKGLSSSFSAVQEYLNGFGSALGEVFGDDTKYAIDQAMALGKSVFDLGSGVARIASGDILGGVQSVISGLGGIFSMGKKVKEMNRRAREENQKFYDEAIRGEREYQQLLRERSRTQQQIGESTLAYNQRIINELNRQQAANNSEYASVLKQLQGEQYITGKGYRHGTWFRKAKTWNEYASLSGKTYEDIEKLYTEGRLENKAKSLFEQLRKLKEEGEDINQMLADQAESMREAYTGTTTESIADSILKGFAEGKRSAADFADDFEELLNNAVLRGVKMKALEEPLRQWYESFAAASQNGLSKDNIAELRRQYEEIIANAAGQLKDMENITGMSVGSASRRAAEKGIQSISQESADELTGIGNTSLVYFNRMDGNLTHINSRMGEGLKILNQVAENTSHCRRLEKIESDIGQVKLGIQQINDKGIRIRTQ